MKRWQKVLAGTALVVVAGGAGVAVWFAKTAEPRLRREIELWLSDRLNSEVSLASVTVKLYPTFGFEGTDLRLRIKGRPDLQPFITIDKWTGSGMLTGLRTRRLEEVRLEGVHLVVPPGRKADLRSLRAGEGAPDEDLAAAAEREKGPPSPLVERLTADAVTITVQPKYADRDPVIWDVRDLRMTDFSLDRETPFTATVDTPLPSDRAEVSGSVGPWPGGDFDRLPMSGQFTFDGDLSAIPGMEGQITASGNVLGTLERLATTGIASSNRLGLKSGAAGRLPMTSTFEAAFDGTSGDSFLSRLTTTLGQSAFQTSGSITRRKGIRGRHVHLAVKTPDPADVADVMRLLVDGVRPPVAGRLSLDASLRIEPGTSDVIDRLDASGTFRVAGAHFINRDVREKIDELARRGQGRPGDASISRVAADIEGRIAIRARQMALQAVQFAVPGVRIDAAGDYGLASERFEFRGVVRLDAGMSRTLTGARRVLLRPLDPLLRKDGAGTRLVLDIRGTKADPKVDIDLGASLRGRQ